MTEEFIQDKIKEISNKIEQVVAVYPVYSVKLFGSYARGEETLHSDMDLLIGVLPSIGLDFYEMWCELEKVLDISVDIVTEYSLSLNNDILAENIRKDAMMLYEI